MFESFYYIIKLEIKFNGINFLIQHKNYLILFQLRINFKFKINFEIVYNLKLGKINFGLIIDF